MGGSLYTAAVRRYNCKHAKLILLISNGLCLLAWAAESGAIGNPGIGSVPAVAAPNTESVSLAGHLLLLEDPGGALSLAEVRSPEWAAQFLSTGAGLPNLGYSESAFWVRFRVRNDSGSNGEWRVLLRDARIDWVDFYSVPAKGAAVSHQVAGSQRPYALRSVDYHYAAFVLALGAGEQSDVYLRIRGTTNLGFDLSLWPLQRFAVSALRDYCLLGMFYGILLVMACYNLFLFVALGERSHLLLVLLILGVILNQSGRDGLLMQFVLPHSLVIPNGPLLTAVLALVAALLFSREFLNTRHYTPLLDKGLLVAATAILLLPLLAGHQHWRIEVLAYGVLPLMPTLTWISLYSWYRGNRSARLYAGAWLLFLVAIFALVFQQLGLVSLQAWILPTLYVGTVWMVLMLSLAQADRINLLKADIEQANRALLQNEAHLEQLVEERTRELVVARDRAEQGSRAKSEFLANMSHELRTPMNAVLGFSTLLRDSRLSARNRGYLDAIQTAGKALLRQINDILDLSRIEAGRVELTEQAVDPRALLREMELMFSYRVEQKCLQMQIDIDQQVPVAIALDEARLRQILINLIGNAVKFTEQGCIHVVLRRQLQDAERRLCFIVSDSGIGIDEAFRSQVFDLFSQRHGGRDSGYGGTGLGLAISQRLAHLMGGAISVESEPGEGTSFTLLLPEVVAACPRADIATVGAEALQWQFERASLLLADDVQSNRELLVGYLAPYGFELHQAATGMEVLEQVARQPPDLILMDIAMPVMDGLEATRRLKADAASAAIPVIAVSAVATPERVSEISEQCDGFLSKPLSRAALLATLAEFLPNKRMHSETATADNTGANTRTESLVVSHLALSYALRDRLTDARRSYASINDIQRLAADLVAYAESSRQSPLAELGQQLRRHAEGFDMAAVRQCLEQLQAALSPATSPED